MRPVWVVLALWVVLTGHRPRRRVPVAGRALPRRQPASSAVVLLALATLAIHRCRDDAERLPVGWLLALILAIHLSHIMPAPPRFSSLMSIRMAPPLTEPASRPEPQRPLHPIPGPRSTVDRQEPATGDVRPRLPEPGLPAEPVGQVDAPARGPILPGQPVAAVAPAPPPAPVTAARDAWRPPEDALFPFLDHIEAWRPLVRQLLAEAWAEGRLNGPANTLDDDLILALIQQESRGDPGALSWAGAIGLMQVMPYTFAEMMHGDRSLVCAIDPAAMWDVPSNVRAGIRYLALAMQAHAGNRYWALAAYNAGIEVVGRWRAAGLYAVPPIGGYSETAAYAQ
ncbi:MAG: lytic transglycosylase domain-containing protein, partial [Chloroflexota bacterium]